MSDAAGRPDGQVHTADYLCDDDDDFRVTEINKRAVSVIASTCCCPGALISSFVASMSTHSVVAQSVESVRGRV